VPRPTRLSEGERTWPGSWASPSAPRRARGEPPNGRQNSNHGVSRRHSAIRCCAQGPWTGQTHPLSAFNPLNSTGLNDEWTNVLVPLSSGAIDYPQIRGHNPARKLTPGPECPASISDFEVDVATPLAPRGKEDKNGLQDWPLSGLPRGARVEGGPLFSFPVRDLYRRSTRWLEKPSKTSGHLFRGLIKRPMLEARCPTRRHGWLRESTRRRPPW